MGQKVRTAVFPVAGRGTRFLPATKASPKEMLPIVDKPLIQYAVEEALEAGATKLIFITGSSKRAIEDHFDSDPELESALESGGKTDLLESIRGIVPQGVSCIYIRQGEPLGLGHAVLCSRAAVGDEPFYVHLADDLIAGQPPCLSQMAAAIATKNYPDSGVFSSAGRSPAGQLNPALVEFLNNHGISLGDRAPVGIDLTPLEVSTLHVIVSLEGPVSNYFDQVPFHTTPLEWDVGAAPAGSDAAETNRQLEELYREVALQVRDLVEILRGEDAS